jgi:hypothetical protein
MRLLISAACLIATLAAPVWAQTPTPQAQPVPRIAEAAPAPLPPSGLRWQRYLRASEVQLQNLAAFVRIRPEDREDVAIAIVNPGPLEAPEVRRSGRRLVIDGRQRGRLQGCTVRGVAGFEVEIGRVGNVGSAQLPIIEIGCPNGRWCRRAARCGCITHARKAFSWRSTPAATQSLSGSTTKLRYRFRMRRVCVSSM